MEILLVFGQRSHTIRCHNCLSAGGYASSIVNSPLRFTGSCTLAVKTDSAGFAYFYPNVYMFNSFLSAYSIEGNGKYNRIV